MRKNKYGAAKVMNVAVVGSFNAPANITKKNISASDTFNAGREYKNQEGYRLPSLEEIYHIPSAIKREWGRMSKAEKIVYGTIFASTVIGLGIAADYKHNEGKTVKKIGDYSKSAGKKISAGAAGFFGDFFKEPPAAIDKIVPANDTMKAANASAAATPQVTGTPNYDYYDEDFKVGIMIEGDAQFKRNVTNLIETWKEVTPDDYKDKYRYAPKKIMRSPDNYNWYGGPVSNDYIQLAKISEERGGSDDYKTRLVGVSDIVPEFRNAMQEKTGVKFKNGTESELDAAIGKAQYAVKIGVMTQEQADNYIKSISEELKKGLEEFYDGAKINQSQ